MSIPVDENDLNINDLNINESKEPEILEEKQEQKEEKRKDLAEEYLNLARVIQADFDNYRKRSIEQIEKARIDGIVSTVEVLLPSLDAFKKVKDTIKDQKMLEGINMLEKTIISSLDKLGVEKIEAVGKTLDPNVHNVLAVSVDKNIADGVVLEEFQAGYKMKDKIIRCSQVLVNKLD